MCTDSVRPRTKNLCCLRVACPVLLQWVLVLSSQQHGSACPLCSVERLHKLEALKKTEVAETACLACMSNRFGERPATDADPNHWPRTLSASAQSCSSAIADSPMFACWHLCRAPSSLTPLARWAIPDLASSLLLRTSSDGEPCTAQRVNNRL